MADPITAEQVERAIETPRHIDYRALGAGWREWAPDYVIEAEAADDWDAEHAALTRWRDELAAAEPVRRVARWDGMAYALDPHHVIGEAHIVRETREEAIAWGYEIEGGPEPIDDTAPERLRERREVVDVPQPEPWHARLVRLASDVAAATKAHEDAQAEREAAERRESDAWTALRNARGALHDATEASAIVEAAQRFQAVRQAPSTTVYAPARRCAMSGLDALERLLAEAEPSAPWRETKYGIIADDDAGTCVVSWDYAWGDAEGVDECTLKPLIVAAVNALPALITRLRAAEARTAWQPIETAPRDGQRVVLYVVSPHWLRPEMGLWHRGREGTGWHQDAERSKLTRGTPTHWQPLPTAPEAP